MYDIALIDIGGWGETIPEKTLKFPHTKTRYYGSLLNTIHRSVIHAKTSHIWIITTICNYKNFDFEFEPVPWEAHQIHCWASGVQKYGDTFLIPVKEFLEQRLEKLEWFKDVNYHSDGVKRYDWPYTSYQHDDLTLGILRTDFVSEYHIFAPHSLDYGTNIGTLEAQPALWGPESHQLVSISTDNSICFVPRGAKNYIKEQVYDYPYINISTKNSMLMRPLDIVYISNGEPEAERWYSHLMEIVGTGRDATNSVYRIINVNGRADAYKAAARASTSNWFFAVFGKFEVARDFNFWWQPDYFQEPKHYIFHSRNPLNGLEYGHQGIIAYNKALVLNTNEIKGLDFTLSKPHSVVPVRSGIAHFNIDPWTTWRTAFREVVKLQHYISIQPTLETEDRLHTWLTVADGNNAEWCLRGANDALEYYKEVNGNYEELLKTFEWDFLQTYFRCRYSIPQPK